MNHSLSFEALTRRQGGAPAVATAIFAFGFLAGVVVRPALQSQSVLLTARAPAAANETPGRRFDQRLIYPAEVVRVIDGDTFDARVAVWPGLSVNTRVRLRDIDAPELHARCADEQVKAEAGRAALATILAEGDVAISRVGLDKYGGRVDAAASTRNTPDVSAAMRNGGWARSYDGGRRRTWC